MRNITHPKDFWAGVMFIVLGGLGVGIAFSYAMGSAGRMGPGYFPRWLGTIMIGLGLLLVARSFRLQGEAISFPTIKPVLIVLAAVLVFGLTVVKAGLVIATILTVLVASTASHEYRWKESVIAAVLLAAFVVAAFRYGLQLQLPTWPPALVG
jgi:hypothetical protein